MNRFFRSAFFPLLVIVALAWLASETLRGDNSKQRKVTYSEVRQQVVNDPQSIQEVDLRPEEAGDHGQVPGEQREGEGQLPDAISRRKPSSSCSPSTASRTTRRARARRRSGSLLSTLLPFVLLFGFWIFLMNQVQGGGSKVMSFGKSRAKRMTPDSPKIGFKDVAGADEAVEELHEIKEFLENPKKFQALGARIPKGVLLYGPPGTGKTLLARAVAGEAGVPFFSISGSDFVEMFVGVGASRVRDLFEQAKQASPCIVFMDEIDAVGRHRGAGLGGGHDEREQTLNQLLVEMDGFELKDNIILIAATNRPDILDPALLRPGRFDRQIVVDRPDRSGRKKILEVHSKGKPLDAADRPRHARRRHARVHRRRPREPDQRGSAARSAPRQEDDRAGGARGRRHARDRRPREEDAALLGGGAPDHRVPRARPRDRRPLPRPGHRRPQDLDHRPRPGARATRSRCPREDRYLTTKKSLMGNLAMTLGGRAAEEIVFNEVTTGAANDLEKVTSTAKQMVMRFGMSEKLGPRVLGRNHDLPFLGREMSAEPDYSEEVAREIDDEIRRIIEEAHEQATVVLREHMEELHRISNILIERETIDKDQFLRLLAGDPEEEVFPDEAPEPQPSGRLPTSRAARRSRGRSRSRERRCSRRPSPSPGPSS